MTDRAAMEAVRAAGLKTAVWTANTEAQLAAFCRWPLALGFGPNVAPGQ